MSKNTFLYKDGKAQVFEECDVEDMLAEGWCDNPSGEKSELQVLREKNAELQDALNEEVDDDPLEEDASGALYDAAIHYKNRRKDENGNWAVRKISRLD